MYSIGKNIFCEVEKKLCPYSNIITSKERIFDEIKHQIDL